ncbi:hypothetical protein ACT4VT_20465 (plasmid) [Acinetobacter baumannii]|jgi:flavodoxin
MKKTAIILALSLILPIYGCSSDNNTKVSQDYSIIKDETKENNAKRVVEIELPEIISQEKLEQIADSIKESTDSDVENVFVVFNIKDSTKSGYWAMVEYTPEKSVRMMGNTPDQEQKLLQQIQNYKPNGKVLGVWEFKWGMDCAIGLYEAENKVFSNYICDTGASKDMALKYSTVNNEQRIEDVEPNGNGEYMVINKEGNLEFRSPNKTYYIGKKIK